jgi:nucleotidyltransferase/DNA polymerase involved in DNA repair
MENHGNQNFWDQAFFMSFKKNEQGISEGSFVPETDHEKKLFIANQISKNLRDAIYTELKYRASAGISHNKTVAKIASSQNKPNA